MRRAGLLSVIAALVMWLGSPPALADSQKATGITLAAISSSARLGGGGKWMMSWISSELPACEPFAVPFSFRLKFGSGATGRPANGAKNA